MARKNIIKILSGCCIFVFAVMFYTQGLHASGIDISVQTFTISGSIDGVEGVELKGFPGDQFVETNSNGEYYAEVEWGESFVVTPKKDGYTFSPSSIPYTDVTENKVNQDFKATPITYTISGKVGNMEGVVLNGLPGNPVTKANGVFSVVVNYGWEGSVEPVKAGFEFNPPVIDVEPLKGPKTLNFTASAIKINISGNVGVGGVVMAGLPGKVVSEDDGSYSVTVDYNYSGTVTPAKEGYTFDPPDFTFQGLTYDQYQDFTSNAKQFTISGTTEMPGVLMDGFLGEVYTEADGSYNVLVDFDFTGTIKPTLPGYSFNPGSIIYTKVREDKTNQNYKGSVRTFVIKGKTGISGVKMVGLPGDPVTTGPEGSYEVHVEYDWSGYVVPEKEGYSFEPSERTYSAVADDYSNDIYVASPKEYTISGNAGAPGVLLRGFPGKPVETDEFGNFTTTVTHGWSGRITPQKNGYDFDPQNIEFTKVTEDQYSKDFTVSVQTFTISGTITSTDKNKPVENITVSFGSLGATTTDAQGKYSFDVTYGWTGGVMPVELKGYSFNPQSYIFEDKPVRRDMRNQNFKATIQTFKIHDVLEYKGRALQNVKITADPGNIITQSNSKGEFTIEVPYGWTGEYILYKEGFNFNPASKSFENVTTDYKFGNPVFPEEEIGTSSGGDTPSSGGDTPSSGGDTPSSGGDIPSSGGDTPTSGGDTPTSGGDTPTLTLQENQTILDLQKQLDELNQKFQNKSPVVEQGYEGSILINDQFIADDLLAVLDQISSTASIPIFYEGTVQGMVTCNLKDVPLDKALEMVLAGTPYYAKKISGNPPYYLVAEGKPENDKFDVISETEVVLLDHISAMTARAGLSPAFKNYVMSVEDDPNARSVTITAPRTKLKRIKSDLMAMDITPNQVILQARIVVMEKGDLLNLGVEWGWPTATEGLMVNQHNGTGSVLDLAGKTAWGIQLGYTPDATFTNALDQVLNLLQVNDEAKIIAKPAILAQDNTVADIKVLREDYKILYASGLSDNLYSRQEMEVITTGTVLSITPHISDTNDIELEVAVEVSDTVPNSSESDLPSVTRRTAKSTLRVYDGGTVAIAGLTENREVKSVKAVPGFSSLPLIGELFKSTKNNKTNKEVAIFITASIVHETEQANQRQIGFVNGPYAAPAQQIPVSSDVFQMESNMNLNRNSSDLYMTQPAAQPRSTASSFDNSNYQYQDDPFFNSSNQNNDSRRRPAPRRSLSPEEEFNMQLQNSLANQGGRYGGSEY
ncbi:MAG: hypothetical protein JXA96_13600 [Sedimentisphaerales bacterium]|nr:hypothetical protein [Sedimentisphaerales bacterium]